MSSSVTEARLDAMRAIGDPEADAVVASLYENGQIELANQLLAGLQWDGGAPPTDFPEPLREFLVTQSRLPPWADPARVERGQRLFMRHAMLSLGGLVCASLPSCYVMSKAVKVLGITQQLAFHPYQRVIATAQMVMAVMTPGGLGERQPGVLSALRVRLLHASIRHLAMQLAANRRMPTLKAPLFQALRSLHWTPADGVPINQEDAAYTLLTFSIVMMDATVALGARPSAQEQADYLHAWNVVGHLMGVRQDLMARTVDEARALQRQILARQLGTTREGVLLSRSLTHALGVALHSHTVARHIYPMFTRHLIGDANADLLRVPPLGTGDEIVRALLLGTLRVEQVVLALLGFIPPVARLESWMGLKFVEHMAALPPQWDESLFALPEDLRDARKPMP